MPDKLMWGVAWHDNSNPFHTYRGDAPIAATYDEAQQECDKLNEGWPSLFHRPVWFQPKEITMPEHPYPPIDLQYLRELAVGSASRGHMCVVSPETLAALVVVVEAAAGMRAATAAYVAEAELGPPEYSSEREQAAAAVELIATDALDRLLAPFAKPTEPVDAK